MIGEAFLNFLREFGVGLAIGIAVLLLVLAEAWVERREAADMRADVQRRQRVRL